jgi:ATP-dependent RNA helicase RhlE
MGMSVAVIFGGAKYGPQIKALTTGIDILVATPGRLMDHMAERTADLSACEILVLDEADQMLDLGFVVPIRKIVATMSKKRQNLFFSATMPTEISRLAGEMLIDPVKVAVTPGATTVERIDQKLIFIEAPRKRALLADLFSDPAFSRTIVFTRTKRGADRVAQYMEAVGVTAAAIHGDKSQGQRERALAAFKAGKVRALIATDIAARGIDIDAVSHVINYELPQVPEAYVHRIGRTARAGADGSAISFCADDERGLLRDIQRTTRQTIPTIDRRGDKVLGEIAARTVSLPVPEQSLAQPKSREGREGARPQRRGGPGGGGGGGGGGQRQGQGQGQGGQRQGTAKPAAAPSAQRWSPVD